MATNAVSHMVMSHRVRADGVSHDEHGVDEPRNPVDEDSYQHKFN